MTKAFIMELTGLGVYTFSEAAKLTGIKPTNLRRWLSGYQFKHGDEIRHSAPLWETELLQAELEGLSFHDLLEVRFVSEFRKHGVGLQTIRLASINARELFNSPYPFTTRRFQTDGKTIFAEAARESGEIELLDLRKKQFAFEQVIRPSLYAGIDFGENDRALRWYPNPRSKTVVLDPAIAFGKPIVSEIGIRTDILYEAFQAEGSKQRVARQFEVPITAVEAAIRFEERIAA